MIDDVICIACAMMWAPVVIPGLFALGELIENALKKRRRLRDFPTARVL